MCLMSKKYQYDLIAQAETGSGKTLAYLVPVISLVHGLKRCSPPRRFRPFAIIIVPTRELAAQIRNEAKKLLVFYRPEDHRRNDHDGCQAAKNIAKEANFTIMQEAGTAQFDAVVALLEEIEQQNTRENAVEHLVQSRRPKKLVENLDVTVALTYGGLDFEVSARDIASGCDIFVGTPGRLIKAVEREGRWGGIYLHNVCSYDSEFFTLIERIQARRQRLYVFSATFSEYSMEFYRQQMTSEPFYILRRRGTNTIDFMWRSDGVNSFMHRIGRTGRAGNRGCAITYFDPVRDRRHGEYIAEMLQSLGENVPEFLRYHVEE
ncbi:hypothetical protein QR680_010806 [Steinernema hermaphroditum]|uniref:Helicase ATP-binding domain-containing protein n=1 Tax=Steinernema hermaphroditum TaxID=289476 RepID=A0AA39ISM1_9BILA|nr:hypothetical protein QR680_010806 [Steinernema hermaphroditum]